MSNATSKKIVPQTDIDYATALMNRLGTKSATIRYLTAEGWIRSRIANAMNIRYQHVRNVLTQPMKKKVVRECTAADLGIEE